MAVRYFGRNEAAKYIEENTGASQSPKTLGKWATTGGGPLFRTFGRRVIYSQADLDAWIASRMSRPKASTSKGAADE